MDKHDFIRKVASETGETIKATAKTVDAVFEVIGDSLVAGDRICIKNFGSFSTKPTVARVCRNVQTGEAVHVPESRKVSFKVSDILKEAVKNG